MHSVSIDFVAGSHGHFLEYVCNKYLAKHNISTSPFNSLGASHNVYLDRKTFVCGHFSERNLNIAKNIIKIAFGEDDLLLLSSVCFLRAGNSKIDIAVLEHDTYNKLKNSWFSGLIDEINLAYPEVLLSEKMPNCPRHVLREFFKFGFKCPKLNGFTKKLEKFNYPKNSNYHIFEFNNFYDNEKFINEINLLADWYGGTINDSELKELKLLHHEFLLKQIFKEHRSQCDYIIDMVKKKQNISIDNLTVLQESYINGCLENLFQIEMPFMQKNYFNSTQDIVQYLNV